MESHLNLRVWEPNVHILFPTRRNLGLQTPSRSLAENAESPWSAESICRIIQYCRSMLLFLLRFQSSLFLTSLAPRTGKNMLLEEFMLSVGNHVGVESSRKVGFIEEVNSTQA